MNIKKSLPVVSFFICLSLLLCACAKSGAGSFTFDTAACSTYYNSYLGLTAYIPTAWTVTTLDGTNLTKDNGGISGLSDMSADTDDSSGNLTMYMLFDISSTSDSSNDEDVEFTAYYITDSDYSTAQSYIDSYAGSEGTDSSTGNVYKTLGTGSRPISGKTFQYVEQSVTTSSGDVYYEYSYAYQIGSGLLMIYTNYWADSTVGKADSGTAVDNFLVLK